QVGRHRQQPRVARVLDAVALQRPEVVAVAQLDEQLLEDGPVAVAAVRAELRGEVALDVGLDAVGVQQGVVDVHEEDDVVRRGHRPPSFADGSCQRSSAGSSFAVLAGPQVPGAYSSTGTAFPRIGSTMRQAASTLSWRANTVVSPSMAAPSSR